MTSDLTSHGQTLLDNGYEIIPITPGYKYPKGVNNWQTIPSDQDQLDKWISNGRADNGVGIRCRTAPAVDIDVRDQAIVERVQAMVQEVTGADYMYERTGSAPKILIPFRTDEPFKKVQSTLYVDPDGVEHKVEILGDGQQYVAFAVHPDTGQPYEWGFTGDPSDTPLADLPLLTLEMARTIILRFETELVPNNWTRKGKGSSGTSSSTEDQSGGDPMLSWANDVPPMGISLERVRRILSVQSLATYDEWLQVGMAIHHETAGSPDGLALWDEISSEHPGYEAGACEHKWLRGFRDDPSSSPRTMRTYQKQYNDERQEAEQVRDTMSEFLERYILVEKGDMVCDLTRPPHRWLSKLVEFQHATHNRRVEIEVPAPLAADPDRTRTVIEPAHKLWLANRDRLTAEGEIYDPNRKSLYTDKEGTTWINTFFLPRHVKSENRDNAKEMLARILEHFEYIFPIEEEREWFLDWLAWKIQHLGKRCLVSPLHVSELQGTGRGWITNLIESMFGVWNCGETEIADMVEGQWGDHLHQKLFSFVHEARAADRYHVIDKMRKVLTEKTQRLNLKHGESGTFHIYTNIFMMTNHWDAFSIPVNDRRVQVLTGPSKKIGDGSGADADYLGYYETLYGYLESPGGPDEPSEAVSEMFYWLTERDVSKFNHSHATKTPGKARMALNAKSNTDVVLDEFLEETGARVFAASQFRRYLQHTTGEQISPKDTLTINAVLNHRCTKSNKRYRLKQSSTKDFFWSSVGNLTDSFREEYEATEAALIGITRDGEDFLD